MVVGFARFSGTFETATLEVRWNVKKYLTEIALIQGVGLFYRVRSRVGPGQVVSETDRLSKNIFEGIFEISYCSYLFMKMPGY